MTISRIIHITVSLVLIRMYRFNEYFLQCPAVLHSDRDLGLRVFLPGEAVVDIAFHVVPHAVVVDIYAQQRAVVHLGVRFGRQDMAVDDLGGVRVAGRGRGCFVIVPAAGEGEQKQ